MIFVFCPRLHTESVSYNVRLIPQGQNCADAAAAGIQIGGKRALLFRGLNIYMIRADGTWRYAQSDTGKHDAWYQRGGGDKAIMQSLAAAANSTSAKQNGFVAMIAACSEDCTTQMPAEMSAGLASLGAKSWEYLKQSPGTAPALFIKDLRSGRIHAGVARDGNGCQSVFRSGFFRTGSWDGSDDF
jgi:hypothetical protein